MTQNEIVSQFPDGLQVQAKQLLEQFQQIEAKGKFSDLSNDSLQQWIKVLLCSDYVLQQINRSTSELDELWVSGYFSSTYQSDDIANQLQARLEQVASEQELLRELRLFRNLQMVRITFRDINGLADLNEVLADLTELANACISQSLEWLDKLQQQEFGIPLDEQGKAMSLMVIGMGKLGAYELNFSSDVDLIFVFKAHGETVTGPRQITHNEYFIKLGQRLIKALDQKTPDGFVFRVDMRLRPFGDSGPLAVTFDALEAYYSTHGREWERYALIKARAITGSEEDRQYLRETLTPFVYRRYIDFGVFESLREMKSMIAREVKQKKKEHNVKLGAGGIREIEFLAQAFQLLRGGRDPHLQERQVQKVLAYLAEQQLIPDYVVSELLQAYTFLRTTEHRIQQINDQQTHNLPDNEYPRARIAYGMGYDNWEAFSRVLKQTRAKVQSHFEQLLQAPQAEDSQNPQEDVNGIWQASVSDEQAVELLSEMGYEDGPSVIRLLDSFRASHRYKKMSSEGRSRLDRLMPLLLKAVAGVNNSETTLKRLLDVIESICQRSVYLSLLIENPLGLSQLVKLCAASSWISRQLARHPSLFDELLDPRVLYEPLEKQQLLDELGEKLSNIAADDLEQKMETLRHFKQSQSLRVAAADVTGVLPVMKVSDYLTWIAEATLYFVLETAWHDMTARYGHPMAQDGTTGKKGFAIIGFGKLGGIELGYSSDLDMVFVYANDFTGQNTEGEKAVDNQQFYSKLSLRIMHILQTKTHSGLLYEADMRLRPNGHSGLITTHLNAFKTYELEKAWTWEHQALVRARLVAGDPALLDEFQIIRREVLAKKRDSIELKNEVREMRTKMRQSLAKKKKGFFDIKQGFGGLADVEFMVQFMVLEQASQFPELMTYTDNIRILDAIENAQLLPGNTVSDLRDTYRTYRDRLHQLSLQEVSGVVPEQEFREQREKIQEYWVGLLGNK
jgi:glutamate-ammonia-ligase adenylyltransferase